MLRDIEYAVDSWGCTNSKKIKWELEENEGQQLSFYGKFVVSGLQIVVERCGRVGVFA